MVAEFYGVDERTIKRYVQDHGEELRFPRKFAAPALTFFVGRSLNGRYEPFLSKLALILKVRNKLVKKFGMK